MRRALRTLFAGFGGALKGLLALGVTFAIMAVPANGRGQHRRTAAPSMSAAFLPRRPVSASRTETVDIEGSREECDAVREALGSLVLSVRSSTLKIIVTAPHEPAAGAAGTYTFPDNVIHISRAVVRDPVDEGLSHVLAHEMGHMLDSLYLDVSSRREFTAVRGGDPDLDWEALISRGSSGLKRISLRCSPPSPRRPRE